MTQLTLQLDDDLVLRAKAYSARSGKPLSDLVAGFLAGLAKEKPEPMANSFPAAIVSETERADAIRSLPERQYRLASQHPGEYVVLVGEHVVHHSTNRQAAGRAFRRALVDHPSPAPVMVDPSRRRQPGPKPIVRGRALNRRRHV